MLRDKRIARLERINRPSSRELPYVVKWPDDPGAQARCQQDIDAREAAGQMVFVIKRAGDYSALLDEFV